MGTRRRSVAELPVLAGGEVCRLFGDVDRVVAEALEAAGDQELVKDELTEVLGPLRPQDDAEHLAVDVVDRVVVLAEALGGDGVAGAERSDRLAEGPMINGRVLSWSDTSFDFTVPAQNCRAQYLSLDLDARMASESFVNGSLWFDDLKISRLAGQSGQ